MIKKTRLGYNIFGTEQPMYLLEDTDYHISCILYYAPPAPRQLIAANYKCCLEAQPTLPQIIPTDEADRITEWVLKGGHTPSLECINFSFFFLNVSHVFSHQIVRHRVGNSIGQQTQRANADETLGHFYEHGHYVTPPEISQNPVAEAVYDECMMTVEKTYQTLRDLGIRIDIARYCIPSASHTNIAGTYAFKTLLDNVLSTRLCHLMQGETVALARLMAAAIKEYDPMLGSYLLPICAKTGRCNRNENNPTKDFPKGACDLTINGAVPVREPNDTMDLTQFSKAV